MRTLKSLLAYIGCIAIAVYVALYIDGTVGIILTIALSLALVISLALTLIVLPFIKVEITSDKSLLTKGERLELSVKLSKSIIIPVPVIEISADCSPQLEMPDGKLFLGSVAGTETTVVKIPYNAKFSGASEIKLLKIMLTDYLGIFRFKIKTDEKELTISTSIYPDIPDAAVQTDFLKTTSMFSDSDDDEEETDETAIGSTGMPGYDHRQYSPGDPIKRINWKLSSKRDIYMVRLDEKVCGSGQMFFLDCPKLDETERALEARDNVIESALAMFTMLVREGREASFFFYSGGLWLRTDIHSIGEVYALQEQLSSLAPSNPSKLIPDEIMNAGKTPICFTTAINDCMHSVTEIVAACPDALIISSMTAQLPHISTNLWTVSNDYEFRKQSE